MRVVLVYRPETALKPEMLEAKRVRVVRDQGLVTFEPSETADTYRRGWAVPIRYLSDVHVEGSPGQNLLELRQVIDLTDAPGAPGGAPGL